MIRFFKYKKMVLLPASAPNQVFAWLPYLVVDRISLIPKPNTENQVVKRGTVTLVL
jgi:hypothetical protein